MKSSVEMRRPTTGSRPISRRTRAISARREGERLAPLVVAPVAPRAEGLLQQVAVGAVQLDPVEPGLDADPRRLREAVEHLLDLGARHPVRHLALAA